MLPAESVVRELTRLVWSTVLGLDVAGLEQSAAGAAEVATSVDIEGAWTGTIRIALSRRFARMAAASMLACEEMEASAAAVRDALGELANMLGGNVKGLLPGPSRLSMPRVEEAPSPAWVEGAQTLWFECMGQPFCVTVTERRFEEVRRS